MLRRQADEGVLGNDMGDIKQVDFGSLSDIPSLMEAAAAEIRDKVYGEMRLGVAVFIDAEDNLQVYGWGVDADSITAIGVLSAGQSWLSSHIVKRT